MNAGLTVYYAHPRDFVGRRRRTGPLEGVQEPRR
jgi:hypothetical protein